MSDTKGQRCCEQGNFGDLHDCAKGQPAESTVERLAEEFHNVYQAEARRQGDVRHKDAYADLPENIKEFDRVLARHVLARGVSEYERGRLDFAELEATVKALLLWVAEPGYIRDTDGSRKQIKLVQAALAATSGTPAEHDPARAPHNKFSSLWCDACPRPALGTPAPQDAAMKVAWQADKIMDLCDEHADEGQIQAARFTLERLLENWRMERNSPATPPPADETLAMPNEKRKESLWKIWRKGGHNFDWLYHKAFADGLAARPSGAQAAAPATTNVREAFEKWYAAYKDITLYIDGMQDAFEAGYNARSKERDAQAAPPGPKCSHGVLMREFCQRCEDGGTPASGTEGRGK